MGREDQHALRHGLQQAGNGMAQGRREFTVAVGEEIGAVAACQAGMGVHARAGATGERLGHEAGLHAVAHGKCAQQPLQHDEIVGGAQRVLAMAQCQLELLDWMDAAEIATMIEKEHPQIAAVVIANLDQEVAGQVLELLPDAVQPEILHRVARLGPITPEAVDTLRAMLASRTSAGGQPAGVMLGGTKEAARILSGARKTTEQRVMPKLFKIDREVAKAIEEALFVFENLLDMDDKNLGTLIRNVDSDLLTRALKGVDEATRNRFLGCMSARAADGIRDEMEARGPMKLSEVLDAQKAINQLARALAKDGTIMMGGDDDYV